MSLHKRRLLIWLAILMAVGGAGYLVIPRILYGSLADFDAADGLVLYAIDGTDGNDPDEEAQRDQNKFCGYPVLGKAEINESLDRDEVVAALKSSVAKSAWWQHKTCWWPRHGIHASSHGKSMDVVICFQCDRLRVYRDGTYFGNEPISVSTQVVLDRYLQLAGISLAPAVGDSP